jgi:stringent starvation protein B
MGDDALAMSSQRPYLLRALYEWIVDNGMTPHVLVDARVPGVRVPRHAVKDGRIVLNIADRAVAKLELGNDALRFTARFAGVSQAVLVPLPAVIAVYARETGQGMALPDEPRAGATPTEQAGDAGPDTEFPPPDDDGPGDPPGPAAPPRRGSHLRIVK